MEIRQNVTRVPKQATTLLVAILAALALGVLGWRLLAIGPVPHTTTVYPLAATTNFQDPDAQDRNAQILLNRIKEDTTHGH